ncbi:hypothetical protein C8Q79DRAFT_239476 [Trametes meyenii]|nr:hypothetical protein C8Q79DRAFT_239476 [Trametes meyenii]
MLSGIGSPAHLASIGIPTVVDLPDVGQSLADHPIVPIPFAAVAEQDEVITNLARNATFFNEAIRARAWRGTRPRIWQGSFASRLTTVYFGLCQTRAADRLHLTLSILRSYVPCCGYDLSAVLPDRRQLCH